MTHITLLGDSIFDNAPYVDSGESVICYLQRKLPPDWKATLLAIDGSVTTEVHDQLRRLPADATHLFLSIGGNDALQQIHYLHQDARSVAEVMLGFSRLTHDFQSRYLPLVEALLKPQLPLTLCTIYNPSFEQAEQQTIAATALTLWNDLTTPRPEVRGFLDHWESYDFTLTKISLRCAPPLYREPFHS